MGDMNAECQLPDGSTLRIEQEVIDVSTSLPEHDPDWQYTDAQGHKHSMVKGKYPMLRWVVFKTYFCSDCNDEHEKGEYRCKLCNEVITPGSRNPSPHPKLVLGLRAYYLNDEPITQERYKEIIQNTRKAGA